MTLYLVRQRPISVRVIQDSSVRIKLRVGEVMCVVDRYLDGDFVLLTRVGIVYMTPVFVADALEPVA